MSITLADIKHRQDEIACMIAKFETQESTSILIEGVTIMLAHGERYGGAILKEDGTVDHHVILLPGDNDRDTHENQTKWAASIGGVLPSRREQSLLFANLKDEFQREVYWSGEDYAEDPYYAWYQSFGNGSQGWYYRSYELRARAVRRLVI
ncbi:hypothetical protein ACW4YW_15210 [Methylobacillus pratensis]